MSKLVSLRVSDLKQWAYCPRIVFYNYVMPVEARSTYKMNHGRTAEEEIDRLEQRRKLTEFGLVEGQRHFHYRCRSDRLALSGKLDLLIESSDGFFPVDFKATDREVYPNHIVQLCGYALILEERFRTSIERGFVFLIPRGEIVKVDLTVKAKRQTLEFLTHMRLAITSEVTPGPTSLRNRCEDCEYRNFCGDIF